MKSLSRQTLIAIGLVVVVVAAAAIYFFTRSDMTVITATDSGASGEVTAASSDALMVAGPLGEKALGDADAPVTVVEYASMTCGHCAHFHNTTYEAFKEKYIDTGKVHFILREYPLDPLATGAFIVARCVPDNRYFPMISLLFEQQQQWATADDKVQALFDLAQQTGLSREKFDACLADPKMLDGVNWVHDRAETEFGVGSTPTFFINGEKHVGALSLDEISALVDRHL